jgi:hypothetical protein
MKVHKKSLKISKGGNQNLHIEEEQTTQWPKEKVQEDKQRSKHQNKTKNRDDTMFLSAKTLSVFKKSYIW